MHSTLRAVAAPALALAATAVFNLAAAQDRAPAGGRAPSAAGATGELWETQTQLVLLGMALGQPTVQRSCSAPGKTVTLPQLPRFINDTSCPDLGVQHDGSSWTVDGMCHGARISMTMREVAPGHREGEFRIDAPIAIDSHGGRIVSRRIGTCTPTGA
jgi:hypothetical protein